MWQTWYFHYVLSHDYCLSSCVNVTLASGAQKVPYLCCPHRPQLASSTWRKSRRPGWPWRWQYTRDTGWWRRCLCCPLTGVSSGSVCEGLPGRCRWTEQRWPRNCERGRTQPPPRGPAGHTLVADKKTNSSFNTCSEASKIHLSLLSFKLRWAMLISYSDITNHMFTDINWHEGSQTTGTLIK